MDKCQVKKGIFVLSTCDSPSVTNCDECSIPICTNHSQYSGPKVLCPECFTKANPEMFNPKSKVKKQLDDDYYSNYNSWYYSTRSYFYNSYSYRPFNEDDYRVFDKKDDMDLIDDKDSGSFFDS